MHGITRAPGDGIAGRGAICAAVNTMRKRWLWLALILHLLMVSIGAGWSRYAKQAARRGVEVSVTLLPPREWGFGVDEILIEVCGFWPGGGTEIHRAHARRLGLIRIEERWWVPLRPSR